MAKNPQATAKIDPSASENPSAVENENPLGVSKEELSRILKASTGTDNDALQKRLANQAVNALWFHKGVNEKTAISAALAALEAIAPTDALEGMLAAQMVAIHESAMQCLERSMHPDQTPQGRDSNLKHAAKLTQVYVRQMEALAKHRGRGQQKITVEHVNVHAGGQAIVGNVERAPPSPSETAAVPHALPDASDRGVPLPDGLTAPKRAKQPAHKGSK